MIGDAMIAPDGFQYGAMFVDGSIRSDWNGHTQEQRALEFIFEHPWCILVRRASGQGVWEEVFPVDPQT